MSDPRGWHSRGYLPHLEIEGVTQFIGWRTADSLPANVFESWKQELINASEPEKRTELARRIEAYCDEGHGECLLKDPRAGRVVQECLFHDHLTHYTLHGWVVMPNHVHVLLTPFPGVALTRITTRLKASSAKDANRVFGREGRLWQPEYYDRYIRNPEHFDGVKRYIEWNPVKAKLVPDPTKWSWSSACPDALARMEAILSARERTRADSSSPFLCP